MHPEPTRPSPARRAATGLAALLLLLGPSPGPGPGAAAESGAEGTAGPFDALLLAFVQDLSRAVSVGVPGAGQAPAGVLGAVGPAGGAAGDAALLAGRNVAGASLGYGQRFLGLDPAAALLAGSGDARQGAASCRGVPLGAEFSRKGLEPTLVVVLGAAPGGPQCAPRVAQWRSGQLSGDWERGWTGVAASGAAVERVALGPHGGGGAIAVGYEAWVGGALAYRFEGTAADLA